MRPSPRVAIQLLREEHEWRGRIWCEEEPAQVQEFLIPDEVDWPSFLRGLSGGWTDGADDPMVWVQITHHADDIEVQGFFRLGAPLCRDCKGRGKYIGFLVIEDCGACHGTGLDLAHFGVDRAAATLFPVE